MGVEPTEDTPNAPDGFEVVLPVRWTKYLVHNLSVNTLRHWKWRDTMSRGVQTKMSPSSIRDLLWDSHACAK